jgi:tetrahydrodipicolinate N-succinyltransferase
MLLTDLVAPNAIIPALPVNSKKQILQELVAKAAELSGQSNLLFRRNSQTGAVEVLARKGSWGGLNEVLHAHN